MPLLVVLALLLVPLAEIIVIIQVGQAIGAGPTILLLVADSVLGAWLVRREGRRAWVALRDRMATGGLPGKELADGALVLVGGTLLLTPGFLTDAVGFFLIFPLTRPLARGLVISFARRYFVVSGPVGPGFGPGGFGPGGPRSPGPGGFGGRGQAGFGGPGFGGAPGHADPNVIEGEVVEDPPPRRDDER